MDKDYSKMIYSIAHKYGYGNDVDDLYQVGYIGLMKALENYKSELGSEFSTYAYLYIKGEILKYIRENKLIKVSKDLVNLNKSINKAKEVLTQKMMRVPTTEELSIFLDIPIEKINESYEAVSYVKSLDYELNDEGKELNLYDSIEYNEIGYDERIIDLRNAIDKLNPSERQLILSRYYEGKSQQETSKDLGMSQVQVSRNESKILTKLKQKLAS